MLTLKLLLQRLEVPESEPFRVVCLAKHQVAHARLDVVASRRRKLSGEGRSERCAAEADETVPARKRTKQSVQALTGRHNCRPSPTCNASVTSHPASGTASSPCSCRGPNSVRFQGPSRGRAVSCRLRQRKPREVSLSRGVVQPASQVYRLTLASYLLILLHGG